MTAPAHPVGAALADAIAGRFPPVDGGWEEVRPWRAGVSGVVAFTGHAYVITADGRPLPPAVRARIDGYGGAHHPAVIDALAGPDGWIDSLDLVLGRHGTGGPPRLVARPDLAAHRRARFAAGLRDDLRTLGEPAGEGLVTLGRGLGGHWEVGIEAPTGSGRRLLEGALTCCSPTEVVVAAVAPGNARAVRTFLATGFTPIASVQLCRPAFGADRG